MRTSVRRPLCRTHLHTDPPSTTLRVPPTRRAHRFHYQGHCCAFFSRACQAASTESSFSGARPALGFARRSSGRAFHHSRVSRAVVARSRKVSPFASARAMLRRLQPSLSPRLGSHVGISIHGRTRCSARKSAGTQVNRTSVLPLTTARQPWSSSAIESGAFGPVNIVAADLALLAHVDDELT